MEKVLEDLFYEHLSLWDENPSHVSERKALLKKIEDEERHIREKLPDIDKKQFIQLENLYNQLSSFSQMDAFASGFRLGARLMMAALTK